MTDSTTPAIAALVLAGGKSSRMGEDKAMMFWDGVPLLKRVTDTANRCCDAVYLMTPWPKTYQDILEPCCIQPLTENPSGQGALVAFSQGPSQIQQAHPSVDWVLLLACDLPRLKVKILQDWQQLLPQMSSET
ncbi:MAG: NTP transferase domain-containing protein, partial [Kamptonema sp. SIO4C4]|nr:NTP transferase domain-containing protein [Kamptonema sp. SIO4C4]